MPSGEIESSKLLVATNEAPQSVIAANGFQICLSDNTKFTLFVLRNKYNQDI